MENNHSLFQSQSVDINVPSGYCNRPCNSCVHDACAPYTLEQHLFSFSENKAYQFLWSSWITEKEQYRKQLETVPATFATYSSHTVDHSETILIRIESLLGENRIRLLSPTDTWLLLQCAYTHDLGMCVSEPEKERVFEHAFEDVESLKALLDDDDFRDFLLDIQHDYLRSAPDSNNALFASVRFLLQAKDNNDDRTLQRLANQLKSTNVGYSRAKSLVATATTSYFRKRHAERTRDYLRKNAQANTEKGIFPLRLRQIVADIDYCHGGSWDDVMKLPQSETGFSSDLIHPQFIAALLRLGDLLDLDSNRFNEYQIEQLGKMPKMSIIHELKHMAISEFLVTPKEIHITARYRLVDMQRILEDHYFKSRNSLSREEKDNETKELIDRSAKSLRAWITMIEDDLRNFSNDWNVIIPKNMTGSIASIRKSDIYVLDQKKPVAEDNIELRYSISSARSSQLIQGADLYGSIWAFVREIVQNAVDASKKQIARNALHFFPREEKSFPNFAEYYCNLKQIEQFDPVRVIINFIPGNGDKPSKLQFAVIDSGIGITYEKLKQMRHIGAIAKSNHERKELEAMPIWLKPTGEFGIGMQSVFTMADSMRIVTYPIDEHKISAKMKRHIKLYCPELGGDIVNREEEKSENEKKYRGTDIEFEFNLLGDIVLKLFFDKNLIEQNSEYYNQEATSAYILQKDKSSLLDANVIFSRLRQFIQSTFTDDLIRINFYLMNNICPSNNWREFIYDFDQKNRAQRKDDEKNIEVIRYRFPQFQTVNHIAENQHNFLWKTSTSESKSDNAEEIRFWYNREAKKLEESASVLLTLKNTKSEHKKRIVKVFYRGIAVCVDPSISAVFNSFAIPGVDLTINIMSGNVSRYLEINREFVKASGYPELFQLIRESLYGFYRTMAIQDEKSKEPFYENFWKANPIHRLNYFYIAKFLGFEPRQYSSDETATVPRWTIAKSLVTTEDVTISQIQVEHPWFINIEYNYPYGSLTGNEVSKFAVTDTVSNLLGLKYHQLKVLRSSDWDDRCYLLYTLTNDVSKQLEISDIDFGILCITRMKEYIQKYYNSQGYEQENIGNYILSIPATEQFKCLAIDKIPAESPGMYLSHFSKFIILPFKLRELDSLYSGIYPSKNSSNLNEKMVLNAILNHFPKMKLQDKDTRALFPDEFLSNFISEDNSKLTATSIQLREMIDRRILPRLGNPADKMSIYRAYAKLFKLFHY